MNKFNKQEADHELKRMEKDAQLSHPFALKMATLICVTVMSAVVLLGVFFGDKTPTVIIVTIVIGIIFAVISFRTAYSACM